MDSGDFWGVGSGGLYSPDSQDVKWSADDIQSKNPFDGLFVEEAQHQPDQKEEPPFDFLGESSLDPLDLDHPLDSYLSSDLFSSGFLEEKVDLSLIGHTQSFNHSELQVISAPISEAGGLDLSDGVEPQPMDFGPTPESCFVSQSDLALLDQYPCTSQPESSYSDELQPQISYSPEPQSSLPDTLFSSPEYVSYLEEPVSSPEPVLCFPEPVSCSSEPLPCSPERAVPLPVAADFEARTPVEFSQPKKKRPYTKRTTLSKESRKDRKKEQNKTAARRYRAKIKDEEGQLKAQLEMMKKENEELKASVRQKQQRLNFIREIRAQCRL